MTGERRGLWGGGGSVTGEERGLWGGGGLTSEGRGVQVEGVCD